MLASWMVKHIRVLAITSLLVGVGHARAELHGGIEIGAKGVKATVIDLTITDTSYELIVRAAETENTTLSAGIAKTGMFDPKAIEQTAVAVQRIREKMVKEFKVSADRIHVVGSSGLFSAISGKTDLIAENRKILADAVEKTAGVKMSFIDTQREAELSIAGIMPRKHHGDSVLIDIGSGNTKGGYPKQAGFVTLTFETGTVTFASQIAQKGGEFAATAKELRETSLRPALRKELDKLPGLAERKRVYLSGGIVWAASTLCHPEANSAFTPLTVKEVDALLEKIAGGSAFPAPDLSGIADETNRKRATKELERVKSTYTPEQLHAGLHLLKALMVEMKIDEGEYRAQLARYGYLGWILAFVVEKGK